MWNRRPVTAETSNAQLVHAALLAYLPCIGSRLQLALRGHLLQALGLAASPGR